MTMRCFEQRREITRSEERSRFLRNPLMSVFPVPSVFIINKRQFPELQMHMLHVRSESCRLGWFVVA
jgi:hypothetical protein